MEKMKISKIDDPTTQMIQQYQNGQKVDDKAPDKQVSGSLAPTEKVNLSTTAKDVQKMKIQELQAQIDKGTYSADAEKIAGKMVGESLLDNLS
jgi:anti-sigma28 factor (negative regulator of flagellin synthesis)